jgi:hypothetical protein
MRFTSGRQKHIFHARNGEKQRFDLVNDPHELRDLASQPSHTETLLLHNGKTRKRRV